MFYEKSPTWNAKESALNKVYPRNVDEIGQLVQSWLIGNAKTQSLVLDKDPFGLKVLA